jgi:site-specific recombinase XerD
MGRPMTRIKLKFIHEYRNRHGEVRRYVRRPGMPKVRLPGLPGSPEFMEAYAAALSGEAPAPRGRQVVEGSFGELVLRYYASPRFANLSPRSQATYRHVLEKHVERDGHRLVRQLTAEKAEKIIADIGATKKGLANLNRSVLSAVFRYAVKLKLRTDNPFSVDVIEPYRLGEHHTWTDAELDAYRAHWPLGTRERLAFAVLLYSAQRVSDAVKLKRTDVMSVTQQKTGAQLSIPAHPALTRAIKAGPSNGIYIIGDPKGRPMTAGALTHFMARAIERAGLPTRCVAHGLRKANQRLLAESGATTKQMQAVSGHRTLKETERYSDQANQALLAIAAIALLPDEK